MSLIYDTAVIGLRRALEADEGKDVSYVIYPFGERGALVKGILNALYHVQEIGVADNHLCHEYENIMSLDEVSSLMRKSGGVKVLFTVDHNGHYEEVRKALLDKVDRNRYFEVFSWGARNEAVATRRLEEEPNEDFVFQLSGKKSVFYLPDCRADMVQAGMYASQNYFDADQLHETFEAFASGAIAEHSAGKTFLDIGANIGSHTMYFLNELQAGNVYSFEPMQHNFEILQRNVALNHADDRVKLFHCGLGNMKGKCGSREFSYNWGASELVKEQAGDINVMRLDDIDIQETVYFIKIDVQGMEMDVLRGGEKLLDRDHPYLVVEAVGDAYLPVVQFLQAKGYSSKKITRWDYLFY